MSSRARTSGLPGWRPCLLIAAALALTALAGERLLPVAQEAAAAPQPVLAQRLPQRFGGWQSVAPELQQISSSVSAAADGPDWTQPYDQQLSRSYRNSHGQLVMLTLAHVRAQRAYTRVHEPADCYSAAGFDILRQAPAGLRALTTQQPAIAGRRMLARRGHRLEAVSYWIRIGELYSPGSIESRWYLGRQRLQGRLPDGILVRASVLLNSLDSAAPAHELLEEFLAELVESSPADVRGLLRGS